MDIEAQPTILVTGGTGFVGRRLCRELMRRAFPVRAAVRGVVPQPQLPAQQVVIAAVTSEADWSAAVAGVDVVLHLAARVHVMNEIERDPLEAFRAVNVRATEALARAAAAAGVRRFVYVSSIKVNGEATTGRPFSARDAAAPCDPYGISKWEAELALRHIGQASGMEVTIVRPPLVYGPGVGGNFLRLLKLVSRGIPLPFGTIDNRRSMIYNGNLADALIACATHPAAAGNTYLVADQEELSTRDLVIRLAIAMGTHARVWPVPAGILRMAGALTGRRPEIDRLIGSLTLDSSEIRRDLNWFAPYEVHEGLSSTAAWFASTES